VEDVMSKWRVDTQMEREAWRPCCGKAKQQALARGPPWRVNTIVAGEEPYSQHNLGLQGWPSSIAR